MLVKHFKEKVRARINTETQTSHESEQNVIRSLAQQISDLATQSIADDKKMSSSQRSAAMQSLTAAPGDTTQHQGGISCFEELMTEIRLMRKAFQSVQWKLSEIYDD